MINQTDNQDPYATFELKPDDIGHTNMNPADYVKELSDNPLDAQKIVEQLNKKFSDTNLKFQTTTFVNPHDVVYSSVTEPTDQTMGVSVTQKSDIIDHVGYETKRVMQALLENLKIPPGPLHHETGPLHHEKVVPSENSTWQQWLENSSNHQQQHTSPLRIDTETCERLLDAVRDQSANEIKALVDKAYDQLKSAGHTR